MSARCLKLKTPSALQQLNFLQKFLNERTYRELAQYQGFLTENGQW